MGSISGECVNGSVSAAGLFASDMQFTKLALNRSTHFLYDKNLCSLRSWRFGSHTNCCSHHHRCYRIVYWLLTNWENKKGTGPNRFVMESVLGDRLLTV